MSQTAPATMKLEKDWTRSSLLLATLLSATLSVANLATKSTIMTSVSTETVRTKLSVARKLTNETSVDYTYIAGCTDPTYQNENCPKKANYSDYAWVGLVKCTNTDSSGQVSWVGCVNDGS